MHFTHPLVVASAAAGFLLQPSLFAKEARVTQIVREVKLLPAEEAARAAALNDRVAADTAVRTGEQSRSELTFADLTITRLGANSIYSYNKSGRAVELRGGSILLRVPKDSGGANVDARAVTVAVTGTTLILETGGGGRSKLIMLEGASRLVLKANSSQKRAVQAGQMLDVPAGATTLPEPVAIDLNQLMKTHPLIVGFPPLPSQNLITAVANRQGGSPPAEPIYQGQPAGPGPIIATGGFGLPGLPFPTGNSGGRPGRGPRTQDGKNDGRETKGQSSGETYPPRNPTNPNTKPPIDTGGRRIPPRRLPPKPTPTPPIVR